MLAWAIIYNIAGIWYRISFMAILSPAIHIFSAAICQLHMPPHLLWDLSQALSCSCTSYVYYFCFCYTVAHVVLHHTFSADWYEMFISSRFELIWFLLAGFITFLLATFTEPEDFDAVDHITIKSIWLFLHFIMYRHKSFPFHHKYQWFAHGVAWSFNNVSVIYIISLMLAFSNNFELSYSSQMSLLFSLILLSITSKTCGQDWVIIYSHIWINTFISLVSFHLFCFL